MLSGATNQSAQLHLRPRRAVESMCAMGTGPAQSLGCPPLSRVPTAAALARGLFCAQLLTRMLHPLAKPSIARHLPAYLVHAVNHRGVISASKSLPDLDQLHFQ